MALLSLNLLLLNVPMSSAHSWLDCSNVIDNKCAGYPLGYPSRNDPNINTVYTYIVKDRNPDAFVCQPNRQDIPGNNPFPPASVTPGQTLHLLWQPDGHLDDANPSYVEIHWSGIPGKRLITRKELGPSTQLTSMVFATSNNCDVPGEPNTSCHGWLKIPEGIQPGTYQMIWWWKYDRNPVGEEYSTCFEIVVGGNGAVRRSVPFQEQAQIEDSSSAASITTKVTTPKESNLAYMMADPVSTSVATLTEDDTVMKPDTLANLTSQADDPLSEVPNAPDNDNVEETAGNLAGDAINSEENVDNSLDPMDTSSQETESVLVEQSASSNASTETTPNTNDDNKSISDKSDTQIASPNTDSLTNSSTANSAESSPISESATGNNKIHNQTPAGKMPPFNNGVSATATYALFPVSGATALLSGALAVLTYLMV
ncbi:hypothetical protein BGZ49_009871 [Haplosporangium sp. Z 27]|nr:hypothetical protein BGZ49_009871 [Haplosporangium sp. Z 27]